ncbi:MAG TPA: hypothetical protein PLD55_04200, partial [bacterium]|nr:hypothetical protein [bacterium]
MIKFDTLKVGLNATKEVEVNNNMKLPATTGTVSEPFSAIFKELRGNYPADSTIYFGENGRIRDANGAPYTTNQGFGVAGATDADGKFTFKPVMLALSLTMSMTATCTADAPENTTELI